MSNDEITKLDLDAVSFETPSLTIQDVLRMISTKLNYVIERLNKLEKDLIEFPGE